MFVYLIIYLYILRYVCIFEDIFVYFKVYIHSTLKWIYLKTLQKKMGMLKLVDRPRLGRGEINSYKFESYYP
jgi:hypothetical protein